MPKLVFKVKYKKNQGIALSSTELIEGYFFGVPLTNAQGVTISHKVIEDKIAEAQSAVEGALSIKLSPTMMMETRDFIRDEFKEWGFFKMGFPVKLVTQLVGKYANNTVTTYPVHWMSIQRNSEEYLIGRTINIVPSGMGNVTTHMYGGIFPFFNISGSASIPNYWEVSYLTGYEKVPYDLLGFIGKLASIPVLAQLGNIVLGAGISSQSLSFDGLSQSFGSTKSSTSSAYGATIKQYTEELKNALPSLINKYKGIAFTAL
jgi:hypothetical protein